MPSPASSSTSAGGAARRALALPFSAMSTVLVGLLAASLPLGAYAFYSDMWGDFAHDYPLSPGGPLPAWASPEAGDAFAVAWAATVAAFAVAVCGPRETYAAAVARLRAGDHGAESSSYMLAASKWFSVLVLATAAISAAQGAAGIPIVPPEADSEMLRFLSATQAPFVEEAAFRVAMVGLPLYAASRLRGGPPGLARFLWRPGGGGAAGRRAALALVAASSAAFAAAHVLGGDPWSAGKATQAAAGGAVLGWAYCRHGLACAVLVHAMANYMVMALAYFAAGAAGAPPAGALGLEPALALEWVLVAAGASAAALWAGGAALARRG